MLTHRGVGAGERERGGRETETEIHREIEIDRESKIAKNGVMCPLRSLPLSCEIQHGSRSNWHGWIPCHGKGLRSDSHSTKEKDSSQLYASPYLLTCSESVPSKPDEVTDGTL